MGILRLMSNNIWKNDCNCPAWEAKGEDCSAVHRAKGLARMYIETDPDIIGLQECSAVMLEELMEHFAAAELPFAVLWGRDTPILYRSDKFELLDSEFALYPEEIPGLEGKFNNHKTKSYLIAVFRVKESDQRLIFATTHLWWKSENPDSPDYYPHSDAARVWQIERLMDRLAVYREKYQCPAVFVGDMNADYLSPAVRAAIARGYTHGHDDAVEYWDETDGHHFCYAAGYDFYE
ncbi:MAG: endonuclease/exonuclease/phosphatase family protein, partial [Clostridia bacterium]|nr:endonuclease/exonuclease/phosphatase family protein [Clostridia bacterium]